MKPPKNSNVIQMHSWNLQRAQRRNLGDELEQFPRMSRTDQRPSACRVRNRSGHPSEKAKGALKTHDEISTPTSDDIEAAIAAIKAGTDPLLRWGKLDTEAQLAGDTIEDNRKPMDFEGTLYRAETIDPDGLCGHYWGMGTTAVAAAASAWIGANLGELWWQDESRPDEDFDDIPREVPANWRFVLYGVPSVTANGDTIQ